MVVLIARQHANLRLNFFLHILRGEHSCSPFLFHPPRPRRWLKRIENHSTTSPRKIRPQLPPLPSPGTVFALLHHTRMATSSRFFFSLLLLLLCGLAHTGFAQAGGRRMLRGNVTMTGDEPQAYIIYFTTSGNKLSGSSITGQKSGTPLKAAIVGQFSPDGKEMYLKETHSLDPRGLGGFTYYCFFTARLRLTVTSSGRRIWRGPFTSTAEDGGPCGGGTMFFEDLPAPPEPRPRPQPTPPAQRPRPTPPVAARTTPRPAPVVTPPRPRPRADTPQPAPRPTPPPVVVRDTPKPAPVVVQPPPQPLPPPDTSGLKPLYAWPSDTLTFEIWDGYEEDGDVVSVFFNGQMIMSQQTLSKNTKPRYALPLRPNQVDTLSVVLHAEGKIEPCTPKLILDNGTSKRDVEIAGAVGQTAKLYFLRKK